LVQAQQIRVMTFNIWVGGEAGKQPLSQTVKVIEAAKADIVGLQEAHGEERNGKRVDSGRKIAEALGWNHYDQGNRTAIISRFPILTNTPNKWGASFRLPGGGEVWFFNVHFAHAPYQPYQLLKIPYANAPFINTPQEAVVEAKKARGHQVESLLKDLQPVLALGKAVFLTGDFNEPSHQDWTPRAAREGKSPAAVEYPTTLTVTRAGMIDSYRAIYRDEVFHRGNTWTPITTPDDPKDRHDRIDFVFVGGNSVKVLNCQVVGESKDFADIVVQPYPSDHRGVVTTVELK
jgi:endonuclease/exonuclease/phosphatase family metal-dependent hydrolase